MYSKQALLTHFNRMAFTVVFIADPGLPHKTGPYVDIFSWTFEIVNELAELYDLKLETFKKEPAELGRLYFVYSKNKSDTSGALPAA